MKHLRGRQAGAGLFECPPELVEAYGQGRATLKSIAAACGLGSDHTVAAALRRLGVPVRARGSGRHVGARDVAKRAAVVRLRRAGLTFREVGKRLGVSQQRAHWLWHSEQGGSSR